MGALYAFFVVNTLCFAFERTTLHFVVIEFYDYYFAFRIRLLPPRWIQMSTTESSAECMVGSRAHICGVLLVACLLSVSAISQCFPSDLPLVVFSLSIIFLCILDWLSACPLWVKAEPLFHFWISLHIFYS